MSHISTKDKILSSVSAFVGNHPYYIFIFSVLLAFSSILYTINNLTFLTNRNDLISPHAKYYKDFKKYEKEFKDLEGLIIVVEGENKQHVKDFVEDMALFLKSDPVNFQNIFYKINSDFFNNKKLLFLTPQELHTLKDKIDSNSTFIHSLIGKPGLESFFRSVNKEISEAMVGSLISDFFGGTKENIEKNDEDSLDLSLVESILEQGVSYLKGEQVYSSPWSNLFIKNNSKIDEDGYFSSNNNDFYYIFVSPTQNQSDFARAVGPIRSARNYIKELKIKHPGVTAGVTGQTALASDEMITTKNDTVKASLLSLVGVSLLLIISLKRLTLPVIAVFTLIISLCWSLGFTTLTIGHLNILSVVFTTVLIGLGIDFGIHFITRYQEERTSGNDLSTSLASTLIGTGKGVIAGAITTSFAFMSTVFADFKGIAELGFIAGTGIIICLIATITLLPAMIIIVEHLRSLRWIKVVSGQFTINFSLSEKAIHPVYDVLLKKPRLLILAGFIFTLFSFIAAKDIRFDYNLLNLQAPELESVQYEMKILNSSDRSAWFGAVVVDSFDKVLSAKKILESLPSVNSVSSIASVIPGRQEEKIDIIHKISRSFKNFPPANNNSAPVDIVKLTSLLKKIHFKMRKEEKKEWKNGKKPHEASIENVRRLINEFNALTKEREKASVEAELNSYQEILFRDFNNKLTSFKEALDPEKINLNNVPGDVKERFIGKTGKFLLKIYPEENIYNRGPMEKFLADISSIYPNATGTAVTASESSRLMKEGYLRGGIYASIVILCFVLISFRDWRCALLATLPLALGALWTLGIMVLFELPFNLANLVILPLIIGIGVDNGIHIVHRYRDDGDSPVSPVYTSTGKAVLLSSLTTMIGFGSLMIASHRGIHSIGVLLTIGVGCCMIASLTVLPAILKITSEKGWHPKKTVDRGQ